MCALPVNRRSAIWALGVALLPPIVAAPAEAEAAEIGRGELSLHPTIAKHYEKFKKESDRFFFAVSEDGNASGYSYCKEFYGCQRAGGRRKAIEACERVSKERDCFIYADANRVLWKGPVTVRTETPPTLANIQDVRFEVMKRFETAPPYLVVASSQCWQRLDEHLRRTNADYFFLSEDGKYCGFTWGYKSDIGSQMKAANDAKTHCEKRTPHACYPYAVGNVLRP